MRIQDIGEAEKSVDGVATLPFVGQAHDIAYAQLRMASSAPFTQPWQTGEAEQPPGMMRGGAIDVDFNVWHMSESPMLPTGPGQGTDVGDDEAELALAMMNFDRWAAGPFGQQS